jgi:regulation of enolase protein 1 (concanavalin A-like superfamily)
MLCREYQEGSHLFRLVVFRNDSGWEVHEERDRKVVRMTRHSDWHRVERAIRLFEQRTHLEDADAH